MLLTQQQLRLFSAPNLLLPPLSPFPFSHSLNFPSKKFNRCSARKRWTAQLSEEPATVTVAPPPVQDGPVELPPSTSPLFATDNDPTPLQTATSLLLTGSIAVFLFRALRRRAKRVKETRFRSSGATKSLTEEALDSLKSVTLSPPADGKSPPSPVQAFLGAVAAGVLALILYKFTTTIEASLNRQTISDNYQIRQITVTIRTIINGICYLATFVFGINSLGLLLYAGQLAFNSLMEEDSSSQDEAPSRSSDSKPDDSSEAMSANKDQSSDDMQ